MFRSFLRRAGLRHRYCEVIARPGAVFWIHDEGGPDAKLVCVPATDVRWNGINDLEDLPRHLRAEIGHFFEVYKELEPDKSTEVRGWQPRAEAERVLEEAVQRHQRAAGQQPSVQP